MFLLRSAFCVSNTRFSAYWLPDTAFIPAAFSPAMTMHLYVLLRIMHHCGCRYLFCAAVLHHGYSAVLFLITCGTPLPACHKFSYCRFCVYLAMPHILPDVSGSPPFRVLPLGLMDTPFLRFTEQHRPHRFALYRRRLLELFCVSACRARSAAVSFCVTCCACRFCRFWVVSCVLLPAFTLLPSG